MKFGRELGQAANMGGKAYSAYMKYAVMVAIAGAVFKMAMPMVNEYKQHGSVTIPIIGYTINVKDLANGDLGGLGGLTGGTGGTSFGGAIPQGKAAIAVLNKIPVKGKGPKTGYSRAQFGPAWTDKAKGVAMAGNGCDTRDDILKRDMTNVKLAKNKCTVLSGTLNDPYTGKVIHFERGPKSALVQIDHVVPLGNAWVTGAAQWSAEKRMSYANNPILLLAVDGAANGSKGDRDASGWMPPNRKSWCSYAAAMVNVKHVYGLWVTTAEKNTLTKVLSGCAG